MGASFSPRPLQPTCWDDVRQIIGAEHDVPIERIKTGRIVRKYEFKELGPCGRRSCHQLHGFGYIVALLGGGFINIGHCCAAQYAGAEHWERMVNAFDAETEREARDLASARALDSAQLKQHWLDARKEQIDQAAQLLASFRKQVGTQVLREIERRAERGDRKVEVDHRLTEHERELRRMAAMGDRKDDHPAPYIPATEVVTVGELRGLTCFRPGRDPVEARATLQRLITVLLTWTRRPGDAEDTRQLNLQAQSLGQRTADLEDSLRAVDEFFSERNIRLLMRLKVMRAQGVETIIKASATEVYVRHRPGWSSRSAA